jgi:ficolin
LTFFVVLVVLSAASEGQVTTDIDQCQLQCTPHQFISLLNAFTARVAQTETSIKAIRDRPDVTEQVDRIDEKINEILERPDLTAQVNRMEGELNELKSTISKLNETHLNAVQQLSNQYEEILKKLDGISQSSGQQRSCLEILYAGWRQNGVYQITVNNKLVSVYCDMETDSGGWVVFQRRQDGREDFERDWETYASGFGHLEKEFWLGNRNLHALTSRATMTLRVDLRDNDGNTRYAEYKNFSIASEADNFRMTFGTYSGNAGDSLDYHNGMPFTTTDRDHDPWSGNCAQRDGEGGWWYRSCDSANLNGRYGATDGSGIQWNGWLHPSYALPFSEMKIRP